jgi:rhodanese-related sulfurtransferase
VPGAINLPQADLASRLDELPHDCPLVLICRSGARSLRAAQFLRQIDFEQVMNVQGGTEAWRAAGKPLAFGKHSADKPPVIESAWAHAGVF